MNIKKKKRRYIKFSYECIEREREKETYTFWRKEGRLSDGLGA